MSPAVRSPVAGVVVALDDVPDPVFSGRIVGPGVAINPEHTTEGGSTALAPVSGTVAKIHPHAYVITAAGGRSVLVHLGLDTVSLEGKGFTVLAAEGEAVSAGQPVITWSPARIKAGGLSPIVSVIALDGEESALAPVPPGQRVAAGDPLMTWA